MFQGILSLIEYFHNHDPHIFDDALTLLIYSCFVFMSHCMLHWLWVLVILWISCFMKN